MFNAGHVGALGDPTRLRTRYAHRLTRGTIEEKPLSVLGFFVVATFVSVLIMISTFTGVVPEGVFIYALIAFIIFSINAVNIVTHTFHNGQFHDNQYARVVEAWYGVPTSKRHEVKWIMRIAFDKHLDKRSDFEKEVSLLKEYHPIMTKAVKPIDSRLDEEYDALVARKIAFKELQEEINDSLG